MDRKSGRASYHSGNDVLLACTIGDLAWLKRGLSIGIKPTGTNEEVHVHLSIGAGLEAGL